MNPPTVDQQCPLPHVFEMLWSLFYLFTILVRSCEGKQMHFNREPTLQHLFIDMLILMIVSTHPTILKATHTQHRYAECFSFRK